MANALTWAIDAWLELVAGTIFQNEAEMIRIHEICDIVTKVFV